MAKSTASKLPPMKKAAPKAAAKKVTTKAEEKAPAARKHDRKPSAGEKDRVAERLRLAKSYLIQRDGMDEDTAGIVVSSMDNADLDALIEEANTAVLKRVSDPVTTAPPSASATSPVKAGDTPAAPDAEEDAKPVVDFLSVPGLAEATWVNPDTGDENTLPEIVLRCSEAAKVKNEQEAAYKADKKVIDAMLAGVGIGKKEPVDVLGIKLTRYTGKSPRQLNEIKLLEQGVDPAIIAKCWVSGTYDDVRITVPKAE